MAAVISETGHKVKIIDQNNKPGNALDRLKVAVKDSDILGFSLKSFTLGNTVRLLNSIDTKGKEVLCGGVHVTLEKEKFLENQPAE